MVSHCSFLQPQNLFDRGPQILLQHLQLAPCDGQGLGKCPVDRIDFIPAVRLAALDTPCG
ncbi:MAG: hypothetical protein ABS76_37890 [Pelagibacterium sp. SCN 64-44]|nr:MAG: hypothetical protein ABS76_37890 [Pelagibacterium sp. SCN 64-44]